MQIFSQILGTVSMTDFHLIWSKAGHFFFVQFLYFPRQHSKFCLFQSHCGCFVFPWRQTQETRPVLNAIVTLAVIVWASRGRALAVYLYFSSVTQRHRQQDTCGTVFLIFRILTFTYICIYAYIYIALVRYVAVVLSTVTNISISTACSCRPKTNFRRLGFLFYFLTTILDYGKKRRRRIDRYLQWSLDGAKF